MKVTLVLNAPVTSGVGKPAALLQNGLSERGHAIQTLYLDSATASVRRNGKTFTRLRRLPFGGKPLFWLRAGRTLPLPETGIIHFTNQTLAFLARRTPGRSVVSVWDLIELDTPQIWGGSFSARLLYRGIPHASQIITPSHTTATRVRERYGLPRERIHVVPPALPETFRYLPDLLTTDAGRHFCQRYGLTDGRPVVLNVGSEHPRKNLRRLLEAVAGVRAEIPELRFVKVGNQGTRAGRRELISTTKRLGLLQALTLVEESDDIQLRMWYHAATVLVFPSLAEGFGFPPLEAMACGTPVITSLCSSLPEVVGEAASLVDPLNVDALAGALELLLKDSTLRGDLRRRGLQRAAQFTKERTIRATEDVYRLLP